MTIQVLTRVRTNVSVADFRKFHPRALQREPDHLAQPKLGQYTPAVQAVPVRRPVPVQVKTIGQHPAPVKKAPTQVVAPPPAKPAPVPPSQPPMPVQMPQVFRPIPEIRQKAQARAVVAQAPRPAPTRPAPRPIQRTPIIRTLAASNSTGSGPITAIKDIGKGRILLILAAGPSINEVDFSKVKSHPLIDIMCINQPHSCVWPTRFWAFCDHTQFRRNEQIWNGYNGMIINSTNVRARKPNQIVLNSIPGQGFSKDITFGYHIGRSSTYANMQTAYYMNYDKVYIFGCDMGSVNGKLHSYGKNPDVPDDIRVKRFADEAHHYLWAAKNLPEDIRKKFSFCSNYNKWDFTNYFERLDHNEAIRIILERIESKQLPG